MTITEGIVSAPTTVSTKDAWRDLVQCAHFADETPLTRPAQRSEAFEALLSGLLAPSRYLIAVTSIVEEWTSFETVGVAADAASDQVPATAEHPGNVALRDLQTWLQMPLDSIVGLAGLSASTRAFWRQNPSAPIRPSKTGRFLRFHTAVGLLVGSQGPDQARATLRGEGWLNGVFDEDRLVELETRVRNELVPQGLQAPAYLARGGLSRRELRSRMRKSLGAELNQQQGERATTRLQAGADVPKTP